jgi:type IV secretory pathway TrbF-like protein
VKVTRFDPNDSPIIVHAMIWGPRGRKGLTLALDTAATQIHVIPDVLDDIGYGHAMAIAPPATPSQDHHVRSPRPQLTTYVPWFRSMTRGPLLLRFRFFTLMMLSSD